MTDKKSDGLMKGNHSFTDVFTDSAKIQGLSPSFHGDDILPYKLG